MVEQAPDGIDVFRRIDTELEKLKEFSPETVLKLQKEGKRIGIITGAPLKDFSSLFNYDAPFEIKIQELLAIPRPMRSSILREVGALREPFENQTTLPFQIAFDPKDLFFPTSKLDEITGVYKDPKKFFPKAEEETEKFEQRGIRDAEFFVPTVNNAAELIVNNYDLFGRELAKKVRWNILTESEVFDSDHIATIRGNGYQGFWVEKRDIVQASDMRLLKLIRPK